MHTDEAADESPAIDPRTSPESSPAPDAATPRRARLRGWFGVAGLAIAAFVTGLLLFDHLLMPQFIHSGAEVRVPDLTGRTESDAERALSPLGLQLGRAGERFDPTARRGEVVAQDPAPDTPVRSGRRVLVVVSLGEEFSSVPVVEGESVRGAELRLAQAGFTVAGTTRAPSDAVAEGLVAGTDPGPDTPLPHAAPVSLLVSTGTGDDAWVMPSVLGHDLAATKRQLEASGFRVSVPDAAHGSGPVMFQNPPVGARIARGTVIALQGAGGRPS